MITKRPGKILESIGTEPAFPASSDMHAAPGMTYEQWLAGQALAGVATQDDWDHVVCATDRAGVYARVAVERMDAEHAERLGYYICRDCEGIHRGNASGSTERCGDCVPIWQENEGG